MPEEIFDLVEDLFDEAKKRRKKSKKKSKKKKSKKEKMARSRSRIEAAPVPTPAQVSSAIRWRSAGADYQHLPAGSTATTGPGNPIRYRIWNEPTSSS